ncbi:MAG TPA: beta-propeller fold lactonase family protein [Acidimicrobiia bacterium]|nr:beta-propeller fold lactonase family protein [Acidimicrobiia bacterium]
MRSFSRFFAVATVAITALVVPASAAHAEVGHNNAPPHAVFVQTNDPAANAVLAYDRADDGTLTAAGSYDTGGRGGTQTGAVVDPTASQGSVALDSAQHVLFVANAGSDSLSVFGVDGSALTLRQVVPSGGAFPTSIGVRGNLVYVLNTGNTANVQGYRLAGGLLHVIEGSNRALGITNANPPAFLASPGQVGFSPDGTHLIVTTKSTGTIDVFSVAPNGRLSAPTSNPPAGAVPFAFSFDTAGHLVVVEAGTNSVSTYSINADDTTSVVSGPVTDNQKAACWIAAAANGNFYVANAGSATLSGYHVAGDGTLTLLPTTTATAGGPIDLATSADGRYVYSETGGAGTIDEFRVESDGSLTPIGQITGLAAHVIEGIAAA